MKTIYLCFIVSAICCKSFSQNTYIQNEKSWSLAASSGFVFAHTKDVENTKGSHPRGVQADYAWRKTDSATYKKFYGFPVQGITVSYFDFDNTILGNGVAAGYFIEPDIRVLKKGGLHVRAAAGAIWLSNPFHPQVNPTNNSYSSKYSGYLSVGIQPYYLILPKWQIMLAGSYRHTSNGGVKLPNKGINWITAEVMLRYFPDGKTDVRTVLKHYKQQTYMKFLRWDTWGFFATRGIDNTSTVRYGVAGAGIQIARQTGKTHAFTGGAETSYDIADKQKMKTEGLSSTALKSSVLFGHEFLWGKFIFSQQIGIYLFDLTPYYPFWFHRWGIYRAISDKWMAGINLKAHKHIANFPDLRVIYTFSKKEL